MSAHEVVRLTMPADPEYIPLARVTVAGLASRLGFSWDEIEDLRLAVDELCFAIVGSESVPGSLNLRYQMDGDLLEVEGTLDSPPTGRLPSFNDWSGRILTALVDAHGIESDGHVPPRAWLRKTALERPTDGV